MDCKHCLPELKMNLWMSMQDTPTEVKEHLEQCPSCYNEFQWMIRNRDAFSEIEQIQIPTNLHQSIMRALEPELILVKEKNRRNWFEFLQWKPAFSFAAASILLVTLATLRLYQPKPVQTMELLQPDEPPAAMRSLTKEEEATIKDSMSTLTAPVASAPSDSIEDILLEIPPDEFNIWEDFFKVNEINYQRIELEKEEQLVIEGTGTEIVELREELNETLDSSQTTLIHEFLLQSETKAEKIDEEEVIILQLEQSYRITFLKKLK